MHSSEDSTPNSSTDSPLSLKQLLEPTVDVKDVWFHGELSEHDANHLLQNTHPGAFLVRQTGHRRFYLSTVDSEGYAKHLPIRLIALSHFYFDGKRFDSLREVVDSYKEAIYPIRKGGIMPLNGEIITEIYLCLKPFDRSEHDEMSAEVGDVLSLCETDEPGWLMGRNEANRTVGVIPKAHVSPIIVPVEHLTELPYFYDTVSTEMVQYNTIGTFLVRRSSKGADTYALLVKTQYDLVEKFLISGSPAKGFDLAGRPFPSLGHVLARYCERAISGGVRLTHGVCLRQKASLTRRAALQMSSEEQEARKNEEKTRRMFRGASIDTALASASFLSNSMPSPANTVSTGIPDHHFIDRFEEYHDHIATSSTTVASTIALRKSREEKQWKECWLTMSDTATGSSYLAVFDSLGSKLRQQIDLSAATMFWLDESVFSADGCLLLSYSSSPPSTIFLCFRPYTTFLKWVRMLRCRTIFQDVPPPMVQGTLEMNSQVSFLSVEIDKFRSDILKADTMYSASVQLNGVKVGASNCFAPTGNKGANELPVVVIDTKFVIPCIPTGSTTIQLSINSHSAVGKKGRPCGVSTTVCLNEHNESVSHQPTESGFAFRAQRTKCPVLAIERYRPLLEAIRDTPSAVFGWPSQVLPLHFKVFMYSCISNLYALNPCFMSPVIRKVINDVLATSTPEDVFRKDSLATGIITQCLRHLFKTPFDEFLHENSQFSQAIKHQSNLEPAVELLVNFVDRHLMDITLATRILVIASECARDRFGDEEHLVKRTLSAVLILRVLNPIIFATLSAGNVGSQIAKSVQMSANAAASQSPDESLSPSSLKIRRIFDRMILLVDQQKSEFEEKPVPDGELHTEWLSCLTHVIGHSLSLRSSATPEEVHRTMPLSVLELVRAHQ